MACTGSLGGGLIFSFIALLLLHFVAHVKGNEQQDAALYASKFLKNCFNESLIDNKENTRNSKWNVSLSSGALLLRIFSTLEGI